MTDPTHQTRTPFARVGELDIFDASEDDIAGLVEVMNVCFEKVLRGFGIPVPDKREGDRCMLRFQHPGTRTLIVCDRAGTVIAGGCVTPLGERGIAGPLASRHAGAGRALFAQLTPLTSEMGLREVEVVSFPHSTHHYAIYQPNPDPVLAPLCPAPFLIKRVRAAETSSNAAFELVRASELDGPDRRELFASLPGLSAALRGLDLSGEARHIDAHAIGDTIACKRDGVLEGVACCHFGPRSESFADSQLLIKLAYAAGPLREQVFTALLDEAERIAAARQLRELATMLPAWRRAPLVSLRDRGFQIKELHQYFHGQLQPSTDSFESRALADEYLLMELR